MVNNTTKLISEDTIYESPFFRVYQVVTEKAGKRVTQDFIERKSVAIILPITQNDEMFLVKQYRYALQKESLELVAGQIDEGEDPLVAAKRELSEETGLEAKNWEKFTTFNQGANFSGVVHVFIAKDFVEKDAHPDDDEDIVAVLKMPVKDVITKTETGEIDIAMQIAAMQLYRAKYRTN
jgi:ADP-ribose pyrophosphatase